jgi:hypothetical protein
MNELPHHLLVGEIPINFISLIDNTINLNNHPELNYLIHSQPLVPSKQASKQTH